VCQQENRRSIILSGNSTLKGWQSIAQGASPGTAIALTGLKYILLSHFFNPGLAPWAILFRPLRGLKIASANSLDDLPI
jgi:hypothetical protein